MRKHFKGWCHFSGIYTFSKKKKKKNFSTRGANQIVWVGTPKLLPPPINYLKMRPHFSTSFFKNNVYVPPPYFLHFMCHPRTFFTLCATPVPSLLYVPPRTFSSLNITPRNFSSTVYAKVRCSTLTSPWKINLRRLWKSFDFPFHFFTNRPFA